ncbi:MAG TPA: DUF4129 domain-containing protein [Pyrinomonadaceae bacterium]|nr:DUF4129 domain-containing protein [Pyrinomonadaceae bacterium]
MIGPRRTRRHDARKAVTPEAAFRVPTPVRSRRRALGRFASAFFVICFGLAATPARAAAFDEYRERVRRAPALADELVETTDLGEWGDEAERREYEAGAVAGLRSLLPARERVERAGGAVEVDNGWLHKELDAYAALPPEKIEDKRKKIALIRERLISLAAALDEEAAAAGQGARDKEAEKGRLQTILRRPEYNEEAAKGGALEKVLEWLSKLIERLLPKRSPMSSGTASLFSIVARLFVYALALGLIAYLVWRYGPLLAGRARGSRRARAREARVVLGERLAPDQTAADLIAEAEQLARAGNLRGAIRKAYVAVLCELGDRHLIRLAQHKTNRDYLASLRDRAELYGVMHPLTHAFERHWYGFVPASDADWADYRALCNRAIGT